jgi:hypothetical protein
MRFLCLPMLLLMLALAGCSGMRPVERQRVEIGQGLSVQGSALWNRFPAGVLGADAAWTQDGLPLDHVLFFAGHADGAPLFEHRRERRSLEFRSAMTATEIAELWGTELALAGYREVSVDPPQPEPFAGGAGFRFAYAYATEAGLWFDGLAAGRVVDGRLYLIAFAGSRAHHFPAYRPAALHLIHSAEIAAD